MTAYAMAGDEQKSLEGALEQALMAVQTLGPVPDKKTDESTEEEMFSLPPEVARQISDRIIAAVEMGDVIKIASIAKELKAENDAAATFCDKIIQLSEEFDLDGIVKLATQLKS